MEYVLRRLELVLSPLVTVLLVVCLYQVFRVVPNEVTMGVVQRIFYFHVPSAWASFLAFFVVFGASVLYLATRKPIWDTLAHASAELGVLFCTIVLITGPIWARPIWGTWWTWEARLTTTLILYLVYVAYLVFSALVDSGPVDALVGTGVGRVCLVLGLGCEALAAVWIRRILRSEA